ncbi:hypothetical protein FOXYSP1_17053 [Fusarium oxysporum f. sp. phaseoli]
MHDHDEPSELLLPEDNAAALKIVCSIIHHQNREVPLTFAAGIRPYVSRAYARPLVCAAFVKACIMYHVTCCVDQQRCPNLLRVYPKPLFPGDYN